MFEKWYAPLLGHHRGGNDVFKLSKLWGTCTLFEANTDEYILTTREMCGWLKGSSNRADF